MLLQNSNTWASGSEIKEMYEYAEKVYDIKKAYTDATGRKRYAYIQTYGCQQNLSDSERIKGLLVIMGYSITEDMGSADLILFNTCAVRAGAQDRAQSNLGRLKIYKKDKPDLIIGVFGCMTQQHSVAERLFKGFNHIDLIFGTQNHHRFPLMLYTLITEKKRTICVYDSETRIAEGLPVSRDEKFRAWIPIMYGCNNFCSYCIVPYVRGRETSRRHEDILDEIKKVIDSGAKEITLLGQNVNSYGKYFNDGPDFSGLLKMINSIRGNFRIRFMTSNPKDFSTGLVDSIAECEKVTRHIHLPVQSGSNRILRLMNRGYTKEAYLEKISYARNMLPGLEITSDIITGFPGETRQDFDETIELVKNVEYTSLFTFIYSPREGTAAAKLDDPVPYSEKSAWMRELIDIQADISEKHLKKLVGSEQKILVDSAGEHLAGRNSGNILTVFNGDESLLGTFVDVKITDSNRRELKAELL